MVPARTCLGCRQRADRSSLWRIVARDGAVTPDPSKSLPGRGGWVHPARECIETAIKRKAFGRALRVSTALDPGPLLALAGVSTDPLEEMAD